MQYVVRFVVEADSPIEAAKIALGRCNWRDEEEIDVWLLGKECLMTKHTQTFTVAELMDQEEEVA